MLELMILRHAKSDWGAGAADDHQRPLSKRGLRAAKKMGAFLTAADRIPDVALSSTAIRARTTAEILLEVAASSGRDVPALSLHPELYGATISDWLHVASQAVSERQPARMLLAGHEPTCSGVLNTLTGATARFPTGAVAIIRLDDAHQLSAPATHRAHSRLEAFIIPRLLD